MSQSVEELLEFNGRMHVVDIGAAAINETPPYKPLLDRGLARLTAVDGDGRQLDTMRETYGPETQVLGKVIADGTKRRLHLTHPESGMTSLLKPDPRQLAFFNGFTMYGGVQQEIEVETERLADVPELQDIDFLKIDVQGAELMILENSGMALDRCVAIHTEASFIPLYENQPSFADIDRWMRRNGFLPHCFADVKRWSIAPTVFNGDPRKAFNQLLECDIVYIKGLVDLSTASIDQLKKIALIAGYSYRSPDLCLHAVREIERREANGLFQRVIALFKGDPA